MAINPPSDIVLEVARAADPASYRAAAEKLASLGGMAAPSGDDFADVVRSLSAEAPVSLPFDSASAWVDLRNREALAGSLHDGSPRSGANRPYERFEAFVLQSFVETMLPENAETVFGPGNTGAIWKSMLAEHLAAQLARAGGIGIAERISAAHPTETRPGADRAGAAGITVAPGRG